MKLGPNDSGQCFQLVHNEQLLIYIVYHRNLVNKSNSDSKFSPLSCENIEKLKFIECEYLPFGKNFSYLIIIVPIAG